MTEIKPDRFICNFCGASYHFLPDYHSKISWWDKDYENKHKTSERFGNCLGTFTPHYSQDTLVRALEAK